MSPEDGNSGKIVRRDRASVARRRAALIDRGLERVEADGLFVDAVADGSEPLKNTLTAAQVAHSSVMWLGQHLEDEDFAGLGLGADRELDRARFVGYYISLKTILNDWGLRQAFPDRYEEIAIEANCLIELAYEGKLHLWDKIVARADEIERSADEVVGDTEDRLREMALYVAGHFEKDAAKRVVLAAVLGANLSTNYRMIATMDQKVVLAEGSADSTSSSVGHRDEARDDRDEERDVDFDVDSIVTYLHMLVIPSYSSFSESIPRLKEVTQKQYDFVLTCAAVACALMGIDSLRPSELERAQRSCEKALRQRWGEDGPVAVLDCNDFVSRAFKGVDAKEPEEALSAALGMWIVWNLFREKPSDEDLPLVSAAGQLVFHLSALFWSDSQR